MSRVDLILLHVEADLIWYFLKDLFSEISFLHAVLESNELNDITSALPTAIVSQNLLI
jgi:hypothetical protein